MTQARIQQLHQSGATAGQVPVWDATAGVWTPGTARAGMDDVANFDDVHGSPLGTYSYEFDAADTTTLPTGWSWVNRGDSLYREVAGLGKIDVAYSGGTTNATETHRMIVRSIPSESFWLAFLKLDTLGERSNHVRGGIVLRNSTGGNYLFFGRSCGTPGDVDLSTWSALSTLDTTLATREYTDAPRVLVIQKSAADDWSFYVSHDGLGLTGHLYGEDISGGGYDQIGILAGTPDTIYDWPTTTASWFRVR